MSESSSNNNPLEETLINAHLLKQSSKELADTIAQLHKANIEIKKSRRAALNVLEDSILSKRALQESEKKYRTLFNSIDQGFCIIEVLFDEKEMPYDYRFLEANNAFEKQTGLTDAVGKTMKEIAPNHEQYWFEIYGKIAKTGEAGRFENEARALGRYYEVYAFATGEPQSNRVAILFNDITGRKKAEERQAYLLKLSDTLRQANDPAKIQEMAAEILGKYLHASRVLYAEISDDGEYALISSNYIDGVSPFTGKHRLNDFGPSFIRTLENGKTLVIPDITNSTDLSKAEKTRYAAIDIASQLVVSLRKNNRFALALGVYQDTPRNWTDSEVELVAETAERSWIAIEKARAEEALRSSEERLRVTMESAVDFAIINTDVEGIIKGWNTGAEKIFGFTADEIKGKPADIIFTPEDQSNNIPEKEMATAREKGYAEDERWHQRKDGSRFYVSGVMRAICNPELTGYVKIARDMTQQKLMEQQKDDFIGIASHELRTPVTSIKAYTEILLEVLDESDDTVSKDLVVKLDKQVDRFMGLIDLLLDVTRISEGQFSLNMSTFDINELIKERTDELQHTTENHHLIRFSEKPAVVTADRERIGEVLTNLISNAVKYSPKGGDIVINTIRTEHGIQVSVKDQGVGIAQTIKNKVFERFYRVRNATIDTFPGMGLGLYITASIVEQHKGKIWVESEPGKGSTFYFTLPLMEKV